MTLIRSRKHAPGRYLAALSFAGMSLAGMAVTAAAHSETAADAGEADHVTVIGRHDKYREDKVSSPKKTEALIDTPQTISVISKELLSEQNAATLTDALRNTPGITLQLGENGSTAAGDTFQLRGFAAQGSIFLDGIRDLGAVSRDVFTIEQVEVAKGAAGADIGRGAAAGYINLVSKLPALDGRTYATASLYSQGGARATLDTDARTGNTSAVRLNVMTQDIDVAGRDHVKNSGYGIAPSWGIGLGTPTRVYLFAQAVHQDNVPDGGIPTIGYDGFYVADATLINGVRVDPKIFYGSPSDYEKVDAAMLTAKVEHDFAVGKFVSTTRYGQTTMERVLTGLGTGTNIGLVAPSADPSTWTVNRTRQRVDQDNTILANAETFTFSLKTGNWTHDIATGIELSQEEQGATGFVAPTTIPAANLYHPDVNDVLPVPQSAGAYSDGSATTVSTYVFETAKHGPWLLSAGARADSYTIKTDGAALSGTTLTPFRLRKAGTLGSWNVGAVYKPIETASLYVAYANALTPPGAANLTLSATNSNIANAAFKPTATGNLEVGAKWDLFERRLSLTAAWYDTTVRNELALLDAVSNTYGQFGKRKISGIELGAVGQVTKTWQLSAGVQTLHTEIVDGTSGNSATGAATRWSPDLTATVWSTWKVAKRLTVGAGASYTSNQKLVVDPTLTAPKAGLQQIPAYAIADAMASYNLTRRVELQLNVYNLFDTRYIATLNNGGSRLTPGQPLRATLTARVRM